MSRCHTGAGRAGQGGAGEARGRGRGGRRGEWLRPRPPPVLGPGPPRRRLGRSLASLDGAGGWGGGTAAAAAPGRPRGVGVSGRLGSGSSSLQSLPRQRSHHLDPACLGRCCRCEAPEAAPAVTRERGTRPASQSGAPRSVSTRGTARHGAARPASCVAMVPAGFGGPRRRVALALPGLSLGVGVDLARAPVQDR